MIYYIQKWVALEDCPFYQVIAHKSDGNQGKKEAIAETLKEGAT
jgi:hypothetical protein